ncbi:MAG: MerR family transcriptional regulator [Eubacteriales bacterium]|nr:MerR family transcriptional regulator [Eubacteriales bacterium]
MKTVREVSKLTGVSPRTLHYYHQIGLLPPTRMTESGYRLYGEDALARLQQILFLKELDFSLEEIAALLRHPDYDRQALLQRQQQLLTLKRDRLNGLIRLLDAMMKGETTVQFEPFDKSKIDEIQQQYAQEVKERWGDTPAYAQSRQKAAGYGDAQWAAITAQANAIFQDFAAHRGDDPAGEAVQDVVARWQAHITRYHYACSNEILGCLGQMYVQDARFTDNIDQFGEGTAQLMCDAIAAYCASNTR